MTTPDKIYLGIQDMGSGYVYNLSLDDNGEQEYIRKDALMEWLENKIKISDGGFVNGLVCLAYRDVIEHLNGM